MTADFSTAYHWVYKTVDDAIRKYISSEGIINEINFRRCIFGISDIYNQVDHQSVLYDTGNESDAIRKVISGSDFVKDWMLSRIATVSKDPWLSSSISHALEEEKMSFNKRIDQAVSHENSYQERVSQEVDDFHNRIDIVSSHGIENEFTAEERWDAYSYRNKAKEHVGKLIKIALEYINKEDGILSDIRNRLMQRIEEEFPNCFVTENCTVEYLIAIYLITVVAPGIRKYDEINLPGTCKQYTCVGRRSELERLSEILVEQKKHFVIVSGGAGVGKSTLVNQYLFEAETKVLYYDYKSIKYNSFDKVEKTIMPANTLYLAELFNAGTTIVDCSHPVMDLFRQKEIRRIIGSLTPTNQFALVIDHFTGDQSEIARFQQFAEQSLVDVMLIQNQRPAIADPVVEVRQLSETQLVEVFIAHNSEVADDVKEIVLDISKKIYGQVSLMRLIAAWYKRFNEEYLNKSKQVEQPPPKPIDVLSELASQMDANILDKIHPDKKFRTLDDFDPKLRDKVRPKKGKQITKSEVKLTSHIISLYVDSLSRLERTTYLFLGCLGGVELPRDYLEKWFSLDYEAVNHLIEDGMCICDGVGDQIQIRIPKILTTLNYSKQTRSKDKAKSDLIKDDLKVIDQFIEKFGREIRLEENGEIELEKVGEVIDHVHNMLRDRYGGIIEERYGGTSQKKKSQNKEATKRLTDFHLDCLEYCLQIGWAEKAKQLLEDDENRQLRARAEKDNPIRIMKIQLQYYLVADDELDHLTVDQLVHLLMSNDPLDFHTPRQQLMDRILHEYETALNDDNASNQSREWWTEMMETVGVIMETVLSGIRLFILSFGDTNSTVLLQQWVENYCRYFCYFQSCANRGEPKQNLLRALSMMRYEKIAHVLQAKYIVGKEVPDDKELDQSMNLLFDATRMVCYLEPRNRRERFEKYQMIADGLLVLFLLMTFNGLHINQIKLSDYYSLFMKHLQQFSEENHEMTWQGKISITLNSYFACFGRLRTLSSYQQGNWLIKRDTFTDIERSINMNQVNGNGNNMGMNQGMSVDYFNGYNSGYNIGVQTAQGMAYTNGYQQGYREGYSAGFDKGFSEGYAKHGEMEGKDKYQQDHSEKSYEILIKRLSDYLTKENLLSNEEDAAQKARAILFPSSAKNAEEATDKTE